MPYPACDYRRPALPFRELPQRTRPTQESGSCMGLRLTGQLQLWTLWRRAVLPFVLRTMWPRREMHFLHRVDLHDTAILHNELYRAVLDTAQRGEQRTHHPFLLRTQRQVLGRGAHRALGAVTHTGHVRLSGPYCRLILSDLLVGI